MRRISTTTRISIGLACTTVSVLLMALSAGLFPDRRQAELEGRKVLCETVAVECCLAVQRQDKEMMRALLQSISARNPALRSIGIRKSDGALLLHVNEHETEWATRSGNESSTSHISVPIYDRKQVWGNVEFCFPALEYASLAEWIFSPLVRGATFITGASFLLHALYLRRTLRYLNPADVVPARVRATLDTLAEGVMLLDRSDRIVLANASFARHVGRSIEEIEGKSSKVIKFSSASGTDEGNISPWATTIQAGTPQSGIMLAIEHEGQERRTFVVNTTPIVGNDGTQRGALATFDDVTLVEKKNLQLEETLVELRTSRDEIHRQNKELVILATRDPLTGCLNRRSFFTDFDKIWHNAQTQHLSVGCLMVDIDHFKSINDNHGHATGDQVLQTIGALLRETAMEQDLVCRYGGEEFCVVIPGADSTAAKARGELVRKRIATAPIAGLSITASLGASSNDQNAAEAREMMNQADKALYASKHNGRNRVTRFDELPPDFEVKQEKKPAASRDKMDDTIPSHAVSALMAALAYRDVYTAQHSRRVADYCLQTARDWLSPRECYVIEAAALLHDIGKLGVPDAILLKPGPLTPEEWEVMHAHDRMGIDILSTAFADPELTEIVRTHHSRFDGKHTESDLPRGEDIPVGARLVMIADTYDAIVSDRVYRKGRSREVAIAELRRCAGGQFDPNIVERFIQATAHGANDSTTGAAPRQAAILGSQIENVARALDTRDLLQLADSARRVAATASTERLSSVVDVATELQRCASQDTDFVKVVELTRELLELCRATQNSCLQAHRRAPTA